MPDANLVLADRYQARERLGSGAGAGVEEYLGRDLRLARPVVIQVIRGAGKDGFAPQARLMASLDHPAVASVYDWGQQGGLAYLIREYVPGQNLGRLLIERGVLTAAQAAAIGAEIAAALAAAHRIGLAHGSLDAADVIVGDQRVTVVGFGAAWMHETAGATGDPGPDPQADLSALGAMLHQMVTGAPPERRPAAKAIAGGGLPLPLRQVIERLTARDPADRYRAAEAVRADLLHLTHSQTHGPAGPAGPSMLAGPSTRPVEAAADPVETTAPVRVPADPPSWVSAAQGPARAEPGSPPAEPGPAPQARAGPAPRAGPPGGEPWEGEDRSRRRWTGVWIGVIIGLVLLGGAIAAALVLTRDPSAPAPIQTQSGPGPPSVTTTPAAGLPNVVGVDERAAVGVLERDGFVANLSRRPSDKPPGTVTSQSPAAGQRPPRGAIVLLTVSSGRPDSTGTEGTTVPSAPGDTLAPRGPDSTTVPSGPKGVTVPPNTSAQASGYPHS